MRSPHALLVSAFVTLVVMTCVLCLPAMSSTEPPLLLDSQTIHPTAANGAVLSDLLLNAKSRHVLVRLSRTPNQVERSALSAAGLTLLHCIPVRSYLARVDVHALSAGVVKSIVDWAAPIPVADKLSRMLRDRTYPPYAVSEDGRLRLDVRAFKDVPMAQVQAALLAAGVEIIAESPLFSRFTVLLDAELVEAMAEHDEVRWVDLDNPPPVDDLDGTRDDHQFEDLEVTPYALTGAGVRIGQIESGNPDDSHDDLSGRIVEVQSLSTTTHATHVAGIAVGSGGLSSSEGGSALQWRGVATGASMYSWGSGSGAPSRYDEAINTHEIAMATNSWGWTVDDDNCDLYGNYSNQAPDMDHIITGLYGFRIPIFFSAGNERNDCDCGMSCVSPYVDNYINIRPPGATAKNTITVGAKYSDREDLATFSSFGPLDDGRLKPELVAVGEEIGGDGAVKSTVPGDAYGVLGGTSMSTPAVAGAAAIVLEDFRAMTGQDPQPATYKALLVHTADDFSYPARPYFNPGPDYASGYGNLMAKDAIDHLRSANWIEAQVEQAESDTYLIPVPADASEFKVTVAWDDEPGVENAGPALVNDLDLVVTDPLGTRYFPWTLDPAQPASAAVRTAEDHLNPLEQVFADGAITPGNWSIEVRGTTVPFGPQTYSLMFSHNGTFVTSAPGRSPNDLRAAVLHPSHPNPFSPWTTIRYSLALASPIELRVLDLQGRLVRTVASAVAQPAGDYTYVWRGASDSGRPVASGVYMIELRAGEVRSTSRVTLVR